MTKKHNITFMPHKDAVMIRGACSCGWHMEGANAQVKKAIADHLERMVRRKDHHLP